MTTQNDLRRTSLAITGLFFLAVFLLYTRPMAGGDFWWHVNTGRWIVEHGALPDHDPFAFTTPAEPNERALIILKGFWFAQVLTYLSYAAGGIAGVVILKGCLFTAIFLILYRIVLRQGVDPLIILPLVAVAVLLGHRFEDMRPHAFSFLFTLMVLDGIEQGLASLRSGRPCLAKLATAPLLMALWSNLHRGYFIGHAILGVYVVAETAKLFTRHGRLPGRVYGKFLLWSAVTMGAAALNPSGLDALLIGTAELSTHWSIAETDEFHPPWQYAEMVRDPWIWYRLLLLGAVSTLALVMGRRRVGLAHWLLMAGFAGAALKSYRFGIFFILVAVALAGGTLAGIRGLRLRRLLAGGSLAMSVLLAVLGAGNGFLVRGALNDESLPVAAADYVQRHELPGGLFNPYEWGGYLGWRLYPTHRVFVDARTLSYAVQQSYHAAMDGDAAVLDWYGVNTVVVYSLAPLRLGGGAPRLVLELLDDTRWRLAFFDEISAVFLRAEAMPRLPVLGKSLLWDDLIERLGLWAARSPRDGRAPLALGEILAARGDTERAAAAFTHALELDPASQRAREWLGRLRALTPEGN